MFFVVVVGNVVGDGGVVVGVRCRCGIVSWHTTVVVVVIVVGS